MTVDFISKRSLFYLLAVMVLSLVSCGKNEETAKAPASATNAKSPAPAPAVTAEQVRALCLKVMKLAAEDKSGKKLPPAVNKKFSTEICPKLPVQGYAYWRCMQQKMSQGNGFYAAEKVCKKDS